MIRTERLVKSVLGRGAEEFEFEVAGATHKGWRNSARDVGRASERVNESWRAFHDQDIRLLVGRTATRTGREKYAHPRGKARKGSQERPPAHPWLFALPQIPVLDIVELCEVGSQNAPELSFNATLASNPSLRDWMKRISGSSEVPPRPRDLMPHGPAPWRMVQECLAKVMKATPFAIGFASADQLDASFLAPVTSRQAKRVAKFILEVNPEAMDLLDEYFKQHDMEIPADRAQPDLPDYAAAMAEYITTTGTFRMWWD